MIRAEIKTLLVFSQCFLLFLAATDWGVVQGFHPVTINTGRSKTSAVVSLSLSESSDNDIPLGTGPQNVTATATPSKPKKTVFTNEHYVAPVIATPSRVRSSRSKTNGPKFNTPSGRKCVQGGVYLLGIGKNLINAGAGAKKYISMDRIDSTGINEAKLFLKEAGQTILEMGTAWQDNDWERVTYAALDASQTMELVAQSLNNIKLYTSGRKKNDLQQAFAGVGVELKCLSKKKQPEALVLQGFSLRLYQASRSFSSLADEERQKDIATEELEKASRAAQNLANLYGATSFYLPRRWRLWWHATFYNKDTDNQDSENEWETEWQ